MTNLEAIKAIRDNWPDERYTLLRTALEMGIAALVASELVSQGLPPTGFSAAQPVTALEGEVRNCITCSNGCPVDVSCNLSLTDEIQCESHAGAKLWKPGIYTNRALSKKEGV